MKFVPWMVTVVPTLPLAGLKLVIDGHAAATAGDDEVAPALRAP